MPALDAPQCRWFTEVTVSYVPNVKESLTVPPGARPTTYTHAHAHTQTFHRPKFCTHRVATLANSPMRERSGKKEGDMIRYEKRDRQGKHNV